MNLNEYVSAARQFSREEMEACAKTGSCNQCGLCCVAFNDTLPISIPNSPGEEVELFHKEIGEVCPHLRSNGLGETDCAAHQMKVHPSLRHCDEWSGPQLNRHPALGFVTDYGMMVDNFWVWAVHFSDGEELRMANEMIKKGLMNHIRLQGFDLNAVTRLILKALELPELPHEVFGMIQLRKVLERSGSETVTRLKKSCGLNKGGLNPKEREFIERYLPA